MENKQTRVIGATLQEEVLNNQQDYQKQINQVKVIYASLEIGAFGDETLTQILIDGPDKMLQTYKSQVKNEIAVAGIKSERMKQILMQTYTVAELELKNACSALNSAYEAKRKELRDQKILSAALEVNGTGFEKAYAHSTDPKNIFKKLTIGHNSWIATTDGRSWAFEYSAVMMHPNKGDIYLYASCPANMAPAKLLVSYEPLPNTPTEYLVLIKKYDYLEIDFK